MSRAVDAPHRDAAIVLRGLRPVVVSGSTGRVLDRQAAGAVIVSALGGLSRERVALPVRVDAPSVVAADLHPALLQVRTALSRRVRMNLGAATWWLPKRQLASMLVLPRNGSRKLDVGGPGATRYFKRLARGINRPAQNASFNPLESGRVVIVPAKLGRTVAERPTERSILAAALSPGARNARVVVTGRPPDRTTAEARAMGITTRVSRYETIYGGEANRIHNVQLVARLIDHKLIAPGATFSFNRTTGARTADKGFLEAPVIINGELSTGLGGGVCQVSTTVFNAAYEAGLKITSRTNHALYISHYPQGRDATVNYPDVDLQFVNDTDHWLLLRTFVGSSSLVVDLYGAPLHRRVESETRAARHHRRGTGEAHSRSEPVRRGDLGRRERLALELDERARARSTRAPVRCCTTTPGTRRTAARRGSFASGRSPGRAEEEDRPDGAERAERPDRRRRRHVSAVAISSASQVGNARRPVGGRVHAGVSRPAVGDLHALALDRVVEPEAGAAELAAVRAHGETVVEARGLEVAHVRLDRQCLDPVGAEAGIAAAEAREVVDAGDLEPDEVDGVVRDALCVRLGEAHLHLGCEVEVHGANSLRSEAVSAKALAELIRRRQPCVVLTRRRRLD